MMVALDALGVAAHLLDDPVGPLAIQAEHLARAVAPADEPAHVRVVAFECSIVAEVRPSSSALTIAYTAHRTISIQRWSFGMTPGRYGLLETSSGKTT
jgi:hypothetical protein